MRGDAISALNLSVGVQVPEAEVVALFLGTAAGYRLFAPTHPFFLSLCWSGFFCHALGVAEEKVHGKKMHGSISPLGTCLFSLACWFSCKKLVTFLHGLVSGLT